MFYRGVQTPISEADAASVAPGIVAGRRRLLDEIRRRLRLKHDSLRTEQAYLCWLHRYIHANGLRRPHELDGVAVEQLFVAAGHFLENSRQARQRTRLRCFPFALP